jgi:hypothetical protein
VQPHAKFVESQSHGDAIGHGGGAQAGCAAHAEQEVTAYGGQQEYAIVQVMDVGAVQKEIQIRHTPRHDEEHDGARQDEREYESE